MRMASLSLGQPLRLFGLICLLKGLQQSGQLAIIRVSSVLDGVQGKRLQVRVKKDGYYTNADNPLSLNAQRFSSPTIIT